MTEETLPLAELLAKAGDGDFQAATECSGWPARCGIIDVARQQFSTVPGRP
jgi:hypothetical protein